MAIPVFGAAGAALAGASAANAVIAVPAGVAIDDVILVDLYLEGDRAVTAPAGFTFIGGASIATTKQWHYRYWKRATAADTGSYTFSWTTAIYRRAVACRYTGVINTGTPHDVGTGAPVGAARSAAGTITPAVSLTTQGIDRLLVWSATDWSAGTWTPPAGYTERLDSGELTIATVGQAVAGTTGSVTGTATASDAQTASLIALIPASTTQSVTSAGLASAQAFGAGSMAPGPVSTTTTGVGSAEALGASSVSLSVSSPGIASAEAIGAGAVQIAGIITGTGIESAEAIGASTVQLKNVESSGIPSGEVIGSGSVAAGAVSVTSAGVATAETFGTHQVSFSIYSLGIASGEAVGSTTLIVGPISIFSLGIPSAEVMGASTVLVTIDTSSRVIGQRLRITPNYELLLYARIPAESGSPQLVLVDPLDWASLNWSSTLSKPQTLGATCRVSTIPDSIKQRLQIPDRLPTELVLQRNGRTVFAGPLMGVTENGSEVTFEARGLMAYMDYWLIITDTRFVQKDQFVIVKTLVDNWQALSHANYGIVTSEIGTSGILRDVTYERKEIHQISRRIEELGSSANGFDAEVDPTTRELKLWYPTKGVDRSSGPEAIVFDGYSIDGRGGMFSVAPGDLASDAYGVGTAAGEEKTFWAEQANPDLRSAFGRTAAFQSWSEVNNQAELDAYVSAMRDARDQALRAPGRQVRVTPDTDLDLYDVGDVISYEISGLLGIGGIYRIRSRTVNVEQTGQETVTLEFV